MAKSGLSELEECRVRKAENDSRRWRNAAQPERRKHDGPVGRGPKGPNRRPKRASIEPGEGCRETTNIAGGERLSFDICLREKRDRSK
jgi:hypothetical protein